MFRATVIALVVSIPAFAQQAVQGHIIGMDDGTFTFEPLDFNLNSKPIVGDADTLRRFEGLPTVSVQDTGNDTLTIDDNKPQLSSVAKFKSIEARLTGSQYDTLREAFNNLEMTASMAVDPDMVSTESGFNIEEMVQFDTLQAASAIASLASSEMASAVETASFSGLSDLDELLLAIENQIANLEPPGDDFEALAEIEKALYAGSATYPPHVYRRMLLNSFATVGIGKVSEADSTKIDVFCSGTQIGPELILTARHCLYKGRGASATERPIGPLRIVYDFENFGTLSQVTTKFSVVLKGDVSGEPETRLDYALLRPSATSKVDANWRVLSRNAQPPVRQACLSTDRMYRGDHVYLIGHPEKRERTVADNADILFPFAISQEQFGLIRLAVLREMKEQAAQNGSDPEEISALLDRWNASYVETGGAFRHFSQQYRGEPTIGIKVNAFGGNSGGAVFSKRNSRVLGVFRDGSFDRRREYSAGWRYHERAVPYELIHEDLAAKRPGWIEEFMVCAWGRDGDHTALWSNDMTLLQHCKAVCN